MRVTKRMPRPRTAAGMTLAVVAIGAFTLPGCVPTSDPPSAVCIPELSVSPENPKPGRIVTVATTNPCPASEGTEWAVRIQPDGERIPLAQARVEPDADGSFEVSITVPPTIHPGPAIAWIANYWETQECPDEASCAPAEVRFTVAAP